MTEAIKTYYFTQILALAALIGIIWLDLFPALLGGLFVYFVVEFGARILGRIGVISALGKLIPLVVIAVLLVTVLMYGIISSVSFISDGPESLVALLRRMADIVAAGRNHIPGWMLKYLPANLEEWQRTAAVWLRDNAGYFSLFGKKVGMMLVHIIVGMIIGGMIAVRPAFQNTQGWLSKALHERVKFLGLAFRRIVFSQVRISALNAALTGIFLGVIMPILSMPLPLTKTMILVTFIVGLLPIIGNLISNTIIFLIALGVSPLAAAGALAFLIFLHKLEYFFNAHIIGTQIKARAWEILLAMLVMETCFGLVGLIAAPIYYAYLKDELSAQKLL